MTGLVETGEAAALLGVSADRVRYLRRKGLLTAVERHSRPQGGGRVDFYARTDIDNILKQRASAIPPCACGDPETWKQIEPGYQVSDHGRVQSDKGVLPRLMAGGRDSSGYPFVILTRGRGNQRTISVHRLVALVFLGERPDIKGAPRTEICHGDGDKANNHLANLRYDTPKANAQDSIRHGTHRSVAQRAITHCPYGHEYNDENTYVGKTAKGNYSRSCRKCIARRQREHYARVKVTRGRERGAA